MRKEASPGRMRARGVPQGRSEVAFVLGEAWGPFLQHGKAVPRRPWMSSSVTVFCSSRASWRRRALEDTLADEHALFQGPGGERERLWRRRHGQRLPGCGGCLARCCEEGSAWRGAAERAKAVGPACRLGCVAAIRALCSRSGRARDVFDTMPEHARGRGRGWQLTDPGQEQLESQWTCQYDPRCKVTMQRQNHAKTGHAHHVFDKMSRALRHFLEWPKSPDQCLCGRKREW